MKFSRIDGNFYLEQINNLFFVIQDNDLIINELPMYGVSKDLELKSDPMITQVNHITHIIKECKLISKSKVFIKANILTNYEGQKLLSYIYKLLTPELCKVILTCDNDFEAELDTLDFIAQATTDPSGNVVILTFNLGLNNGYE